MPFKVPDYHKSLKELHVGCEEPRAYFIPYASESEAKGDLRDSSSYFKTLIGEWSFKFFPSVSDISDPMAVEFSSSDRLAVPMNWQHALGRGFDTPNYTNTNYPYPVDPPHVPDENPAGVYARTFKLTEGALLNKDVMLNFEGVDSCFYLYVNGAFAGYSQVSHGTSEFNITSLVHAGENEVRLVVLKWCTGSYLEDQDMYRASGIFREVYLLFRDKERIDDIYIHTDSAEDFSSAVISADIRASVGLEIKYELKDALGALVFSGRCTAGEGIELGSVESPVLWSDEAPYLYTLTLFAGGEVISLAVGVRRVEIKGNVVYINGKKVKARGVNRHDSHHLLGHATPMEHILRDLYIMKAHNCNMVRTSHYPNDPRFYALCDRLGIYVCDEADIEGHGIGIYRDGNELIDGTEWTESFLDRAKRMLERDKNHPSVIMWSVGNETGAGPNHTAILRYFKSRDKSRILHAEDESRRADAVERELKKGKTMPAMPEKYREYLEIESRMYPSVADIKEKYLGKDKKYPLFLCEYCHSMGNSAGDFAAYWELIRKHDNFFGGCVWEFTDHSATRGENPIYNPEFTYGGDFGDYPNDGNFCVDGLVYPDRRIHTALLELKIAQAPIGIEYENKTLTVKSYKYFTDMSDTSASYTVEQNGRVVAAYEIGKLNIAPLAKKRYKLNIPDLDGGVVTLNVSVRQNTATEWAPMGYEVYSKQFILCDSPEKRKAETARPHLTETEREYSVSFGETRVAVSRISGLITSFIHEGRELLSEPVTPTVWRAPTDNDMYIKKKWYQFRYDKMSVKCYGTEATLTDEGALITAHISLGAPASRPLLSMVLEYTLAEGAPIKIKCSAKKAQGTPMLPRFGFKLTLPEGFEDLKYFGFGPYESYEDKRLASRLSLFNTTVKDNFEPYIRPQENSAHFGCRWATVTSAEGLGMMVGADSFSLTAQHFTPEDLTVTAHDYELVPREETTLIVDYRNSGIGSHSCGPELDPKYRISESEISFEFSLMPVFTGNVDLFEKYSIM